MKTCTFEDLYIVPGKAEIVNGEIVHLPPTGDMPGGAGFNIALSLREYERRGGAGRAYPDKPTIYQRGEFAEAEPAVPGWRMPVDDLFA